MKRHQLGYRSGLGQAGLSAISSQPEIRKPDLAELNQSQNASALLNQVPKFNQMGSDSAQPPEQLDEQEVPGYFNAQLSN